MNSTKQASERFFRFYMKHCVSPDLDTLFSLLNAIHSLHDKYNTDLGITFYDVDEFVALKAIRNFFHHQDELKNELKLISASHLPDLYSDLMYLCLVPRDLINRTIDSTREAYRETSKQSIERVFHFYGEVVNINPCIYNYAIKLYESLNQQNIDLTGQDFCEFKQSYEQESESGQSHLVSGHIYSRASEVETIINKVFNEHT